MSAIRIPGPDGRTILRVIDDGATPHRGSRGIRGATFDNPVMGSHAVGESTRTRDARIRREYKERDAEKARERRARCAKPLGYIGAPCARTAGHKWDCKSAESVGKANADRAAERAIAKTTIEERLEKRRTYQLEWKRQRRAALRTVSA